jgi:hypothetical protein
MAINSSSLKTSSFSVPIIKDRFMLLKNKFLFGSYNQGSIYALGLNSTHFVSDEIVINSPEIVENIISIAQSPSGDIYFGGYNIYKLTLIETEDKEQKCMTTTSQGKIYDPVTL